MRLITSLAHFFRAYKLFSVALVGTLAAIGLYLGGLHSLSHGVLIVVIGIETLFLLWGMIQDLRHGTYGVDILAAAAIITALLMQEYWAAMVIVLMLTGGESLEDYAEHRAKKELDALLTRAPRKARVLRGRKEVEIRASEVQVGDKIVLRAGDLVPVDAVILEGSASFDEASITGESIPQAKEQGAVIVSGSINLDGSLVARALHSAADSQYEQIIKLVTSASKSKAPFVRMADRYAIPFTVVAFTIATIAWILSGESIRFLEVLVVATPCPLILAAPIAIISGMSRAAKQGIIIKNGSALERLAQARTIAFDKTGTLTRGELEVDTITTYGDFTKDDVLRVAAAVEQHSHHVIAQALVKKAQNEQIKIAITKNVKETAGQGLQATVQGKEVLVGRLKFIEQANVTLPKQFNAKSLQSTAACVAIGGQLAGVITFKDEVRTETKSTIERLKAMGIHKLIMITGDHASTAKKIAQKVGIKDYVASALPADKIHTLEKLSEKERPVAFVGDGVNDAPVLTASDVGIALGARGSTAASESADVVIMQDDLGRVADGVDIAKRTFFIAKQSISVGIGLSVILMLIFSTGKFKPIYGAVIQEAVDVIVIFNALRAHGKRPKPAKN